MGCTSSKAVDDEGRVEKGDYIAKQNVTIWNYLDGGDALKPFPILENARVEVGIEWSRKKVSTIRNLFFRFSRKIQSGGK